MSSRSPHCQGGSAGCTLPRPPSWTQGSAPTLLGRVWLPTWVKRQQEPTITHNRKASDPGPPVTQADTDTAGRARRARQACSHSAVCFPVWEVQAWGPAGLALPGDWGSSLPFMTFHPCSDDGAGHPWTLRSTASEAMSSPRKTLRGGQSLGRPGVQARRSRGQV